MDRYEERKEKESKIGESLLFHGFLGLISVGHPETSLKGGDSFVPLKAFKGNAMALLELV